MFLKVMHDGADEFLATPQSEATYSIYDDVTECHFERYKPPGEQSEPGKYVYGEAHIRVREPVKTANVTGFCEINKHIMITGDAFLMNEQERTISKFVARPFGSNAGDVTDDRVIRLMLGQLPYSVVSLIRRVTMQAGGSVWAKQLTDLLDDAKVAMDVMAD